METVSIIIVTFNTRELTLSAVQSVFDSGGAFVWDVIVVDNGSRDGTEAAVKERFPGVKYISSERNLGFARANNLGAREAVGEWILLLNSDARLKPDSVARAIGYLREHAECGVLGAQLLNEDGTRQNSIANHPTLATELLSKSLLRRLAPEKYPGKEHRFKQPVEVESVIGAFLLTPRRVWEAIGGLDERFFFFLEETDFCLNVMRRGWSIVHHPDVEVWHGQGGSARQVAIPARIEYWRSRYQYFAKNHPPGAMRWLKIGLCIRLVLNWLLNALAVLLTLGLSRSLRHRFRLNHTLVGWHLAGRPEGMGIPR
ncbi:MAG TPA: glycosyltransferase family 2 protein [Verrucomicrobiales bacterium]|nr:glycosyltransferase family 2 protein [Verrucomicrobiales bacterium]